MLTTLILGATPNPSRYAYMAAHKLSHYGYKIINVGIKRGQVAEVEILNGQPDVEGVDTVTLYVGPRHQPPYYDWLIGLRPRRIIFNPGTENPELAMLANKAGIETEMGCTLIMLSNGLY